MDLRRRHLERQTARGDLAAARRLLVARVRQGELTWARVALAAHLGDATAAAALAAAPSGAAPRPRPDLDLESWAGELAGWGQEVCVRAALASGRLALAAWEESVGPATQPGPAAALEAVGAWLAEPGPVAAAGAARARRAASLALVEAPLGGDRAAWLAGMALVSAADAAAADPADRHGLAEVTAAAARDAAEAVGATGARLVRRAIGAGLLPWALGPRDVSPPQRCG